MTKFVMAFTILAALTAVAQAQTKQAISNYVKNNDRLAMVFDVNNRQFVDALNGYTSTMIKDGTFNNSEYIPDLNKPSCVITHDSAGGFINGGIVDFDADSVAEESVYAGQSLRVQFSGFVGMGPIMNCFKPTTTAWSDQDLNGIFGKLGEVFQWQKLNANEYNSKLYLKIK